VVVVVVVAAAAAAEIDVSSEFATLICRDLTNVEWSRSHADRLTKLERQLLFYYKLQSKFRYDRQKVTVVSGPFVQL
jgi:hypothetical protein